MIRNGLFSIFRAIISAMPDVLFLVGIGLLWYGLWLHEPWISFAVTGALLSIGALISKRGSA